MRKTIVTRGIILRCLDYSETSLIVTLLGEEQGKVQLMYRGGKRKKQVLVDPLTVVELSYYYRSSKTIYNIGEVRVLSDYGKLRSFLGSLALAQYIVECCNLYLGDTVPMPRTLVLVEKMLFFLDRLPYDLEGSTLKLWRLFYELKFLMINGYTTYLHTCQRCGGKGVSHFSSAIPGVVCVACATVVDADISELLPHYSKLVSLCLEELMSVKMSRQQLDKMEQVLEAFCVAICDQRPRSLNFVRSLEKEEY